MDIVPVRRYIAAFVGLQTPSSYGVQVFQSEREEIVGGYPG